MAKILLGICLMLVVASSVIYEAQGHFMLKDYLEKKFPSNCNEFAPFANKGMLELATDLQGSCPPTAEFKTFFTQFKLYVTFLESASATSQNIDAEMTTKCDELFKSMAPLCSGKGVKSTDAGAVKVTMLAMGKTVIAEKKNRKPVTSEHKKQLATDMSKWTNTFGSFVKTASERKGKPLDIATYGLNGNANAGGAASGGKTESGSSASTKTESGSSTSTKTESKSASAKSGSGFKDTTGPTLGSPSGSPKASPSGSSPKASPSGSSSAGGSETSTKGNASAGGKASGKTMESKESKKSQSKTSSESSSKNSSSSSTYASPKQVQEETSKEVMTFIMELEKKNSAKSELKIFFEKLKATMKTACATTAAQNPKEYAFATRSASDKLSEAMTLVGSRNQESKMKSNMDTSKNELLNSVKQIQDMTSKMSSEKSVTSTQKTEMKQTVTKMEQATTKFVETASSSSSSSSSSFSSSSSASSQQQQGSAGMVKKE